MGILICPECHEPQENLELDSSKPENWVCINSLCLNSIHHRGTTCDKCRALPAEITADYSYGYTDFLCQNGHEFSAKAKHIPEFLNWFLHNQKDTPN